MEEIKISVVIPFYNARDYVTQAVESALQQPEVSEVLLIEDGSPDGGLEVCQKLVSKYPAVKLLCHPDGKNHGAAVSRNLGIQKASFPYIAFLDADDYYLPNRFSKTVEVFNLYKNADGVYEAIGITFQNESIKELWSRLPFKEITTVSKSVKPEMLFIELMNGLIGYFHLNGLTIRESLLEKTGLFSEKLKIHEDSDLIYKLSAQGTLYPGCIEEPIAIRRVHDQNRITYHVADRRKSYQSYIILWESLLKWGKYRLSKEQKQQLLHRYITHLRKVDTMVDFCWRDYFISRYKMLHLITDEPSLLFDTYLWRRLIPSLPDLTGENSSRLFSII